ncbi:MAG TPA: acetyl-CoA carboxylase, carboxyltransferase subunit beta [Phycisphaerae bacterium]|nr:acetyl-CoA carboxylase, carboxyltransferase subunit beta [Phycisphaerae bacterium]
MAQLQNSLGASSKNLSPAPKTVETLVENGNISVKVSGGRATPWEKPRKHVDVPEGLWLKCPDCGAMIYRKTMEEQLHTCPECRYHFRLGAAARIQTLVDPGSFEEMDAGTAPKDVLKFVDKKSYAKRLQDEQKKSGAKDGLRAGRAFVKGRPVMLAVMDFTFMAGSMGAVVGEKLTRAIERATRENLPFVVICCSGGARMQESTISLMQMAKTSAALARFDDAGGLFISVLSDPTYGGVTASFAMLGDVIFAEPNAMIGFAGPRVIASTIRAELPEGFQTAEFLQEKGFVDKIVGRHDLRSEIARVIDYCGK